MYAVIYMISMGTVKNNIDLDLRFEGTNIPTRANKQTLDSTTFDWKSRTVHV